MLSCLPLSFIFSLQNFSVIERLSSVIVCFLQVIWIKVIMPGEKLIHIAQNFFISLDLCVLQKKNKSDIFSAN